MTSDFWRICDGMDYEPIPVPISLYTTRVAETARAAMFIRYACESPIEVMLGAAISIALSPTERLQPQFWLERFRYDFALIGEKSVLIECDGAEFHSTDEQKETDRQKNDAARRNGILLLRFTGHDIYWRAHDCAAIAISALRRP